MTPDTAVLITPLDAFAHGDSASGQRRDVVPASAEPLPALQFVIVVAGSVVVHLPPGTPEPTTRALGPTHVCWLFPGPGRGVTLECRRAQGWAVSAAPNVVAWRSGSGGPPGLAAAGPGPALAGQLSAFDQRWTFERLTELAAGGEPGETALGVAYVLARTWRRTSAAVDTSAAVRGRSPAVLDATQLLDAPSVAAPWTTSRLARVLGLSPGQLARRFRVETGTTVTGYRLERQLDRYLDLCDDDRELSITDAAFAAGFGSYAQFHRVFVRRMGTSPSRHRIERRRAL